MTALHRSSSVVRQPVVPRLRSLTVKLTVAFLVIGILGAVLVALFVSLRTGRAFDQFISDRTRETQTSLVEYYTSHGSWANVSTMIPAQRGEPGSPFLLLDLNGKVLLGDKYMRPGTMVKPEERARAIPIEVNGETVGLFLAGMSGRQFRPGSPEGDLMARIRSALIYGAGGAAVIAVLLGGILAQTLTRPLRELTTATEALAQGALGQQVGVRSRDELGVLAASFNRMSRDLAQASAQRRQMTADIAHDLRTPLSVILGFTEVLQDGKLPPSQEIFDTMHTEALHLQHLIDDLRTLSLADAGELTLHRQPIAPEALLERAAARIRPQADARDLEVKVRFPANLPLIDVDPERMAQVLGNLLSNAVRHTDAGGMLTLEASAEPIGVVLRVSDTGSGIPPQDLPHIFERFYRADPARQQDGSSGLGLAITKSLVEAHGGEIVVTSTLGVGTSFAVQLPGVQRAKAASAVEVRWSL